MNTYSFGEGLSSAMPMWIEWVHEVFNWPEMPHIPRLVTIHFKPMSDPRKRGHAGATSLILDNHNWDEEDFKSILVHEWAHVWDFQVMTAAQRTSLYSGPLRSWRSKTQKDPDTGRKVRYSKVPDERFAATVGRMICEPRMSTAGINRFYEPFNIDKVRRYTMPFNDTSHLSDEAQRALQWGLREGKIEGYPDGSFRPHAPVTRIDYLVAEYREEHPEDD